LLRKRTSPPLPPAHTKPQTQPPTNTKKPQGETCVEVLATYNTSRVRTSPPYQYDYAPMGDTTTFSRKVCLYKLTQQADATLTFDMCSSNKCELRIGAALV
jgi:hypothetical protein